ncbi:MAG: hypothetical protein IT385_26175 [Deltaproteobacteria bacterium]|nr:hypothetical protein [Deltaproteobacteria bacterium]
MRFLTLLGRVLIAIILTAVAGELLFLGGCGVLVGAAYMRYDVCSGVGSLLLASLGFAIGIATLRAAWNLAFPRKSGAIKPPPQ